MTTLNPEQILAVLKAEAPVIQWKHITGRELKARKGVRQDGTLYFDGVFRGGYFPVAFKPGIDRRTVQKVARAAEEGFKKAHGVGEL